jgi:putative ABC transport system permease protein
VALSVVLLSGAALLFETLWHLQNDHRGFRPEHVLSISIPLRGPTVNMIAREALALDVLTYLRRIPGTEAAAFTQCTPISAGSSVSTFSRSDRPLPEPFHRGDNIHVCGIGTDYFKAAGTRLIQGRFFTDEDFGRPGTIAVINEAAARAYFPRENALDKQILGFDGSWKTIVGVVADTKNQGLNQPASPEAFVNALSPRGYTDPLFLVRTMAPEGALARALQEQLRTTHAGMFTKMQTLDEAMGEMTASPRFNTVLLAIFAGIAFLMAIVGVYGLLAFSVVQRRHEIGVRMALGASPRAVLSLVIKEGAILVAVGAFAGVAAALVLTRYLVTLLYGVRATDLSTYLAVVIGLALAASIASFIPARRAAALDPMVALRHE